METIPSPEVFAQEELRKVVDKLQSIRLRLELIHENLPVPSDEGLMLVGEADMDEATEMRSVIECVLNDSLLPAIRDLQAAAAYRPSGKDEISGEEAG